MRLETSIRVKGTRLDYGFRTWDGTHFLWIADPGESVESKVAGHIINSLIPYRDGSAQVRELIKWLSGFGLDGQWRP